MARKKATKLKITSKDERALQHLAKTALITQDVAENYGLGKNRLSRLEKEGYIKRFNIIRNQKEFTFYKLNREGIKYIKNNIPSVNKFYKGASLKHDLALSKEFSKLTIYQQNLALTEVDQILKYGSSKYASPVDIYIPRAEIVLEDRVIITQEQVLEIITRNYKDVDIQHKINYIKEHIQATKEVINLIKIK
jgi:DNA-binding Lrp family transcriptional regulator